MKRITLVIIALSVMIGVVSAAPTIPFPGCTNASTDPDFDGLFEDVNGNGMMDYDDPTVLYWNINWVKNNSYTSYFDFNGNNISDYDDAVTLFWEI